jgi:transposase
MRLDEAPGVGPVLATAVVATVADPKSFRSGRNFSAWIGIVPKQHSSGGKNRLGGISKQGDRYLRGLFVAGALVVRLRTGLKVATGRTTICCDYQRLPTKHEGFAIRLRRLSFIPDHLASRDVGNEAFHHGAFASEAR